MLLIILLIVLIFGFGSRPRHRAFPPRTRSVSDWFDVKDRGTPSGVYTSGAYIGRTLAPPILTAVMLAYDWRVTFIVMGIAGVVAAGFWFMIYREPRTQESQAQDEEYLRANREAKSEVSLRQWSSLFRFRAMWALMLGAFCTGYITWMYQTWLPAYLEMQQHISIAKTGFLASVPLICAFFGALAGGSSAHKLLDLLSVQVSVVSSRDRYEASEAELSGPGTRNARENARRRCASSKHARLGCRYAPRPGCRA